MTVKTLRVDLLLLAAIISGCSVLFVERAHAQDAYVKPDRVQRNGMDPERVALGEGHYNLVSRSWSGQVVEEEEYVLGQVVRRKRMASAYPMGHECQVEITTINPLGPSRYEWIQYDRFGTPIERWTGSHPNVLERHEKWNRETRSWEAAPERQFFDVQTGKWVDMWDGFVFEPSRDFWDRPSSDNRKPWIYVNHTVERSDDARRVIELLKNRGYVAEPREARYDPNFKDKAKLLMFRTKQGGTQTGAQRIAELVKVFEGDLSPSSENSEGIMNFPAYELWIVSEKQTQQRGKAVRILHSDSRLKDAQEAQRLLQATGFIVKELWKADEPDIPWERRLICNLRIGATETEAGEIVKIVKNVERLIPRCDTVVTAETEPEYVLWIVGPKQAQPSEKTVRIVYIEGRLPDAEAARRLLQEKGFTVSELMKSDVPIPNKVYCYTRNDGTENEAKGIAEIVKNIERVVPECVPWVTVPQYVLWIATPK
ncbi:MAG: hypothetical protein ABL984_02980 [Pyrinomonadaceae bacterium]